MFLLGDLVGGGTGINGLKVTISSLFGVVDWGCTETGMAGISSGNQGWAAVCIEAGEERIYLLYKMHLTSIKGLFNK